MGRLQTPMLYMSSNFYARYYINNKFIHTLTFTYNEVMRLLELAGVVEHK